MGAAMHDALHRVLALPCGGCGKDEWNQQITSAWSLPLSLFCQHECLCACMSCSLSCACVSLSLFHGPAVGLSVWLSDSLSGCTVLTRRYLLVQGSGSSTDTAASFGTREWLWKLVHYGLANRIDSAEADHPGTNFPDYALSGTDVAQVVQRRPTN